MANNDQVELDFLGLQKETTTTDQQPHPPRPRLDRRRSFCGISKINPEIVKSVLASSSSAKPDNVFKPSSSVSVPVTPLFSAPYSRPAIDEKAPEMAPMTIFYNGSVSVFDLPKDKAEDIIKFVMEKDMASKAEGQVDEPSFNDQREAIFQALDDGDLPIKRKKSLQRFFEKRKERLISVSPYPTDHVVHLQHKTSA